MNRRIGGGTGVTGARQDAPAPQTPKPRNTRCVRTHWIWGFMTFQLVRRTRIVMLMILAWLEYGSGREPPDRARRATGPGGRPGQEGDRARRGGGVRRVAGSGGAAGLARLSGPGAREFSAVGLDQQAAQDLA